MRPRRRQLGGLAAIALVFATQGTAGAVTIATSSVWASDAQLVYCTASNAPGRIAWRPIKGKNQFTSCKFDLKDKPKNGFRANIFVVDQQKGVNVFYSDTR